MNLLNEFEVYQLGCHLLLSPLVWATQFLFAWSCWWQLYYIMALWRDVRCSSPQLFIKCLSFPSSLHLSPSQLSTRQLKILWPMAIPQCPPRYPTCQISWTKDYRISGLPPITLSDRNNIQHVGCNTIPESTSHLKNCFRKTASSLWAFLFSPTL